MNTEDVEYNNYLRSLDAAGLERPISARVTPAMKENEEFKKLTISLIFNKDLSFKYLIQAVALVRSLKLNAADKSLLWPKVIELLSEVRSNKKARRANEQFINLAVRTVQKKNYTDLEEFILDPAMGDNRCLLLRKTKKFYSPDDIFVNKALLDPVLSPLFR